jgi:glutathione synthase/RimK-type ligase-like ATP-grasp enzyme
VPVSEVEALLALAAHIGGVLIDNTHAILRLTDKLAELQKSGVRVHL